MLGGGGMATVQAPFSNTRCRQMVSKILIFWKWVLPWLCLISAFQTPTSYKWNDTGPFAFYAVNRVLRFGFWQSEFGFQIVKVPVFRHNNLLQNPTYFTLLEVIYLLSKVQIKYQGASIIVLAVEVLDQSLCVAGRPYTKWALSSLSFQNSMKYGMKEEQLISYTAWHTACVDFFTNVLTIDERQLFQCENCEPRPSVLVFDGIAMGIMKSELNRCKSVMEKDLGYKSNVVIAGSNFEERMFIKLAKNRKLLRESAKKGIWPSTKESNAGSSESELEFEPGQKENENTPMKEWTSFWNSLKNLIGPKVPTKVFCSWWKICLPAQVQLDWCRNLTLCLLKRSFSSWKATCLTILFLELRTQICTWK